MYGEWTSKHVITTVVFLVAALLFVGGLIGAFTFSTHENNVKNKVLWEKCLDHNPVANCKVSIDGENNG